MTNQEFTHELSNVPFAKYRAMKPSELFRHLADELEAGRMHPAQCESIVQWYLYRERNC